MPISLIRLLLPIIARTALSGCSTNKACFSNDEYLKAKDKPPLRMPAGLTASERIAPLQIPPVDPDPEALNPKPRCLDMPPPFSDKPLPGALPSAPDSP